MTNAGSGALGTETELELSDLEVVSAILMHSLSPFLCPG